jgi:hypothetical protein
MAPFSQRAVTPDRDPAARRLGERLGEPEHGAEQHDLPDQEVLDVVRPGQRVIRRDVGRHHGGEENAQQTRHAAEEEGPGAVHGNAESQGAEGRHQVEHATRDAEEKEERRGDVRLGDAGMVLHPEEGGERPVQDVDADEAGDRLIGVEPGEGEVERQEEPEDSDEREEPEVTRGSGGAPAP